MAEKSNPQSSSFSEPVTQLLTLNGLICNSYQMLILHPKQAFIIPKAKIWKESKNDPVDQESCYTYANKQQL